MFLYRFGSALIKGAKNIYQKRISINLFKNYSKKFLIEPKALISYQNHQICPFQNNLQTNLSKHENQNVLTQQNRSILQKMQQSKNHKFQQIFYHTPHFLNINFTRKTSFLNQKTQFCYSQKKPTKKKNNKTDKLQQYQKEAKYLIQQRIKEIYGKDKQSIQNFDEILDKAYKILFQQTKNPRAGRISLSKIFANASIFLKPSFYNSKYSRRQYKLKRTKKNISKGSLPVEPSNDPKIDMFTIDSIYTTDVIKCRKLLMLFIKLIIGPNSRAYSYFQLINPNLSNEQLSKLLIIIVRLVQKINKQLKKKNK